MAVPGAGGRFETTEWSLVLAAGRRSRRNAKTSVWSLPGRLASASSHNIRTAVPISWFVPAADGNVDDFVKVQIYLTDLGHFTKVNEIMATYFHEPYPARAAIGVASLPRGALVEVDAVMYLN